MSDAQKQELRDLVEGITAGRLIEAGVSRKVVVEVSRNAGAYVVGQLRNVVVVK